MMGDIGVCLMNKIIILSEWSGNSWGESDVVSVGLGAIMLFFFIMYFIILLTDQDSWGVLLIMAFACAILLWFPLNDCVQHRGETFQKIVAPAEITQEQLLEKYDTVESSQSNSTPVDYNCWVISFKQVD